MEHQFCHQMEPLAMQSEFEGKIPLVEALMAPFVPRRPAPSEEGVALQTKVFVASLLGNWTRPLD